MSTLARLFLLPLPLCLLLIACGASTLVRPGGSRARRRIGTGLASVGLLTLWAASTPFVSTRLMANLERQEPLRSVQEMPEADAVVALSYGRSVIADSAASVDQVAFADRALGAIRLVLAGKAPRLVLTGEAAAPPAAGEGRANRHLAVSLGVPDTSIAVAEAAANTLEEARSVRALLTAGAARPRVILVTSAFHMRRARAAFEAEGLEVLPFPVGCQVISDNAPPTMGWPSLRALVPSAAALAQTDVAIREIVGWMLLPRPAAAAESP